MRLDNLKNWRAPDSWQRITCIDAHTCGEPLRIYLDGFPVPEGDTMLARRRVCKQHFDNLRTATMWEPRGHADMYGCLITPPERSDSHFGVLFTHNEGYSSMCGHGIIAVATVAVETGLIARQGRETQVRIDTPAGLITAWVHCDNERVRFVRFQNVPSFVTGLDQYVDVPGLGCVQFDLAFGGAFYAVVDASQFTLSTASSNASELIALGRQIKQQIVANYCVDHPFDADLSFLYGVIFSDRPNHADSDERNVCIFADAELDRSPTGTGVSARLAIANARGELEPGRTVVYESIIGSQLHGRIVDSVNYADYAAVIPEVEGCAFITGRHEFLFDPDDPLADGFFLR